MGQKCKRFEVSKDSSDTVFVNTDGYTVDVHFYDGSNTAGFYFSVNENRREKELHSLRQLLKAVKYAIEKVEEGRDDADNDD